MIKYIITQKIVLLFVLFLPFSFTFGQFETNAVCLPEWKNEIDAVVRIQDNYGRFYSGVLVNTTAGENNNRHFILTKGSLIPSGNSPDLSNWKFYWHYQSPWCNYDVTPNILTTTGARLVAKSHHSAFALIELFDDPGEQWDITPYYVGWDRLDSAATGSALIFHPHNGMKKILKSNSSLVHADRLALMCNKFSDKHYNTYWGIRYSGVYPEFGAPLLNLEHRLIGQYADSRACSTLECEHFFGKFSRAWEGQIEEEDCQPDSTNRLKDWLDPLHTGQETLDGRSCQKTIRLSRPLSSRPTRDYHAVERIISKQEIQSNRTVTYKAGTEIVLTGDKGDSTAAGFHAHEGSDFSAIIEELDCSGGKSISYSPQKGKEYEDINTETSGFLSSQLQIPPKVNIVPNPNSGVFNIEANFPLSDIANLKITNMLGVPVYETQNLTSTAIQLQTSSTGIFFVVMILKDGSVLTQKMMVQ